MSPLQHISIQKANLFSVSCLFTKHMLLPSFLPSWVGMGIFFSRRRQGSCGILLSCFSVLFFSFFLFPFGSSFLLVCFLILIFYIISFRLSFDFRFLFSFLFFFFFFPSSFPSLPPLFPPPLSFLSSDAKFFFSSRFSETKKL